MLPEREPRQVPRRRHGVTSSIPRATCRVRCFLRAALFSTLLDSTVATWNSSANKKYGFALIPIPVLFEPLSPGGASEGGAARSLLVDAPSDTPKVRLNALVSAYEAILDLNHSRFEASSGILDPFTVAIILRPTVARSRKACGSLVGDRIIPTSVSSHTGSLHEWHVAVLSSSRLVVCAVDAEGAFRFSLTLRQLLRTQSHETITAAGLFALPPFVVEDKPAYAWRGLQLDCVRHFMSVEFLKRYLLAMAFYKANVFHWHLTDDQAWRLDIHSRPKLVTSSAHTSPGFYTHDDVREIVRFATSLFIEVMPVIETPGHSLAALAAYPNLSCSGDHFVVPETRVGTYTDIMCVAKQEVATFAREVFSEVVELFPSKFIHIGGDETIFDQWEASPHVRAFAGMLGLDNLRHDVMEAWFCFVGNLLREKGRTPVIWDDHMPYRRYVTRKCPNAEKEWVVQAWKMGGTVGTNNEASVSQYFPFRSIASPLKVTYLDYPVGSTDFNLALTFRPGAGQVMGGCANMWTEDSTEDDVGAKVYPRFMALIQQLWHGRRQSASYIDKLTTEAAQRHCLEGGPLSDFGFTCGRFELRSAGRLPVWLGAKVRSSLRPFGDKFSLEMALDGDAETTSWFVSPAAGSVLEVTFQGEKWLTEFAVVTGSQDRPGDQFDSAELWVSQRHPNATSRQRKWTRVATFADGTAKADVEKLKQGPVAAIAVLVKEKQTKWVAIPEILVVEDSSLELPIMLAT